MSREDASEMMRLFTSDEGQKFINELTYDQQGGHVVFSVIGFISLKLSASDPDPLGTLIYATSKMDYSSGKWIFYREMTIFHGINCF